MLAQQSKNSLSEYDLVISTPMRLLALIRGGVVNLRSLRIAVLDEYETHAHIYIRMQIIYLCIYIKSYLTKQSR